MHTTYSGAIISAITAHACYTCGSNGSFKKSTIHFGERIYSHRNRKKQKKRHMLCRKFIQPVPGAKLTSAARQKGFKAG